MRRGNKYGAKRVVCAAGHVHDSKREAFHCAALHKRLEAGEIVDLECQPQFWFEINGKPVKHRNGRRVGYKPDFMHWDVARSICVVTEVKGFAARDWPLRRAMFEALFPEIELVEV